MMNKEKVYIIIISVLFVIGLIFGLMWFLGSDSGSKERIKQFEEKIGSLEKEKQTNEKNIEYWKKRFSDLQKTQDSLNATIGKLEKELASAEAAAAVSKTRLETIKKELIATRKKIEEFKKNPPNRTGDSLLESIKNKTSKK
jgi:peptidoglycan hydrolase CwlO-like protein